MCAACSFLWNHCSTVLCPDGALLFHSPTLWCPFSVPPYMNYSLPKSLLDLFTSQWTSHFCLFMGRPFSWVACIIYRRYLRCINSAPKWLICPGISVYAWPPSNCCQTSQQQCSCWSETGTFDMDQGGNNLLENLTVKALTAKISLMGLCSHWWAPSHILVIETPFSSAAQLQLIIGCLATMLHLLNNGGGSFISLF